MRYNKTIKRKEVKIMDTCDMAILMVDYGIATDDEIALVTAIDGYRTDILEKILYIRTGYRTWEQFTEEMGWNA
jgi:hypothetical protein